MLKGEFKRQLTPLLEKPCVLLLTHQQGEDCHDFKPEQECKEQRKATMKGMYTSTLVEIFLLLENVNFYMHII